MYECIKSFPFFVFGTFPTTIHFLLLSEPGRLCLSFSRTRFPFSPFAYLNLFLLFNRQGILCFSTLAFDKFFSIFPHFLSGFFDSLSWLLFLLIASMVLIILDTISPSLGIDLLGFRWFFLLLISFLVKIWIQVSILELFFSWFMLFHLMPIIKVWIVGSLLSVPWARSLIFVTWSRTITLRLIVEILFFGLWLRLMGFREVTFLFSFCSLLSSLSYFKILEVLFSCKII